MPDPNWAPVSLVPQQAAPPPQNPNWAPASLVPPMAAQRLQQVPGSSIPLRPIEQQQGISEGLEGGGLIPENMPTDILAGGMTGGLESVMGKEGLETVAKGASALAKEGVRKAIGTAAAFGLMDKASSTAEPLINKIPGQGPAGQIARGFAGQVAGLAPLIAGGMMSPAGPPPMVDENLLRKTGEIDKPAP